jgi:hypothetical protein
MEKEDSPNKRKVSGIEVEEEESKRPNTNTCLLANALRLELSQPIEKSTSKKNSPDITFNNWLKNNQRQRKPCGDGDSEDLLKEEEQLPGADKPADASPVEEKDVCLHYLDDDIETNAMLAEATGLFQTVVMHTTFLKNTVVPHHLVVRPDHYDQLSVDIYRSFFNLGDPHEVKVKILGLDEKNYSIRDLNVLLKLAPKESRIEALKTIHTALKEQVAWLEPLAKRCCRIADLMRRMDFKPDPTTSPPLSLGTRWSTKLHPVVSPQDLNWGNKYQASISKPQSEDWLLWSSALVAMLEFLQ